MSKAVTRQDGTVREVTTREARETGEDILDLASLDGGLLPAPAPRCRIRELQHWMDLCA